MSRQISTITELEPWRISLRDLRTKTGMTNKQIADKENLSEKSVARVFSGEAKNPGVDLIRRVIHAMGGTWSEIFAESGAVIGSQDMATLQAEVNRLTEENALLTSSLELARMELSVQKDKLTTLEAENKILSLKLECEEKIVAIHNYYIQKGNN